MKTRKKLHEAARVVYAERSQQDLDAVTAERWQQVRFRFPTVYNSCVREAQRRMEEDDDQRSGLGTSV